MQTIPRDECLRLLRDEEVGRVAFVVGGRAEVLPVNYVMDGDGIVFRTAPGLKLHGTDRAAVTFEVDRVDRARHSGWSVVVHGVAHEVESLVRPATTARIQALGVEPWDAPQDKPFYLRIAPVSVTGRRVGTGWPASGAPMVFPAAGFGEILP